MRATDPRGATRILAQRCIDELALHEDDLLVDLCCGARALGADILVLLPLRYQVVAVDSSPKLLARLPVRPGLRSARMDVSAFCHFPATYDKILVAQAWRRVRDESLLCDLRRRLRDGGALLIVEPVPTSDAPVSKEALRRWELCRTQPGDIEKVLRHAGWETRSSSLAVPVRASTRECRARLEARSWPLLETLSDDELRRGAAELVERAGLRDELCYTECYDLVRATPR